MDIERRRDARSLVLVSHGDALQILETAMAGRDASTHFLCNHLPTAGLRELTLDESDRPTNGE